MVTEVQYTNIRRVLDNLLSHPLLNNLSLEQVVRHTIRFIALFGFSKFYKDAIADIEIHEFRGLLPCDCIAVVQVKDLKSGICLRSMTDSFTPGMRPEPPHHHMRFENPKVGDICNPYIPHRHLHHGELAFKTQNRVIYTSFPEGMVQVAYKGIPVDEDGFPLVIDNEVYLNALEAYIKKQVFTVKFDTGDIALNVLQNAQRDYAVAASECEVEFLSPSPSEVEAYSRMYNTLISKMREFDKGFVSAGDREYLRNH